MGSIRRARPALAALFAIAALSALAALTLAFASCGESRPRALTLWSSTRELGEYVEFYREKFPAKAARFEIEIVQSDPESYEDLLLAALRGQAAPDLFVAEAAQVKRLAESGLCLELSGLGKRRDEAFPYVIDAASDSGGRLFGLAWEISPGAYFYRRSIAAKYLGTDDPSKIQSLIQDNGRFLAAAETLKQKSAGKAVMIPSLGDLYQVHKAGRQDGWVRGGRLVIDPAMILLLEQSKAFYASGYTGNQSQMGEGWFAALRGELRGPRGEGVEVLGCFLPAWGLETILKPNSLSSDGRSDSSGDWAMARGPVPYFWGGEWLMAAASGKNKGTASRLLRDLCSDPALLALWARERGRPVSSAKAMEEAKKRYSDPFLGGQNAMASYASIAAAVNGKNLSGIGPEIDALWQKQQSAFVVGDKDVQKAISDFKAEVRGRFPDVQTE